jgi:hypothetical protein
MRQGGFMEKSELARSFGPIHDRIGPIVDPAFLNILNQEQIKNIALTIAKAELNAAVAQAKALEDVVAIVAAVKVQTVSK